MAENTNVGEGNGYSSRRVLTSGVAAVGTAAAAVAAGVAGYHIGELLQVDGPSFELVRQGDVGLYHMYQKLTAFWNALTPALGAGVGTATGIVAAGKTLCERVAGIDFRER